MLCRTETTRVSIKVSPEKEEEAHIKSSDSLFRLILGGLTKAPDVEGIGGGGVTTLLFTENPLNIMTAVDVA
jgi:hypothetical protein